MKKILHIPYGGISNGGVASVILSIVETLDNDYEFGCLVYHTQGSREHLFIQHGHLYRIKSPFFNTSFGKKLEMILRPFQLTVGTYRICRKYHYDIVHAHNGYDMVFCLFGAFCAGVQRRIAHNHNTLSPQKPSLLRRMVVPLQRKLVNLLATDKIGCSQKACDDFFHSPGCIPVPNAINLKHYTWKRNPHEGLHIVHVGRFDYQKNQSFVIDIVNEIRKQVSNCKLNLVGYGKDEHILRERVNSFQLDKVVTFSNGKETDIHEAYADADIMIFPSRYEGFGIVLIEAQATGCYVFASDVVPSETNIGAMRMLSLRRSAAEWADTIIDYWKHDYRPLQEEIEKGASRFDEKEICKIYKQIYD